MVCAFAESEDGVNATRDEAKRTMATATERAVSLLSTFQAKPVYLRVAREQWPAHDHAQQRLCDILPRPCEVAAGCCAAQHACIQVNVN